MDDNDSPRAFGSPLACSRHPNDESSCLACARRTHFWTTKGMGRRLARWEEMYLQREWTGQMMTRNVIFMSNEKNWEKKWHIARKQMMLICEAFGLQITMCDPEPYLRKLLSESLMHGWNMTEPARIPLRQRRCSSQCVFVVTKKHKSTKLLEAFKQRPATVWMLQLWQFMERWTF